MTESPGWNTEDFLRRGEQVLRMLCEFVDESRTGRHGVVRIRPLAQLASEMDLARWIAEGGMGDADLEAFMRAFLASATRLHDPAYAGHQISLPHYATALADLVTGTINNGMSVFEMGPTSGAIEVAIVDWMLAKVGWPPSGRMAPPSDSVPAGGVSAGGVLTHGGALANMTALLAARATVDPQAWKRGVSRDLVLLAPDSAHYAISRALSIMGMGADALVPLETDDLGRILPDRVAAVHDRVTGEGRRVMALCANACATATGLHDPLEPIADFCAERGIWFHVDGAHGASALLSERERTFLKGVERADSLVWDAHKMLLTSALCAAVLFRDRRDLERTFPVDSAYVVDGQPTPGVNVIEHQFECTKTPLGLRILMTLALAGEAHMAANVERLYANARRLYDVVADRPGFEPLCRSEANIFCFRRDGNDEEQTRIRRALFTRGDFLLTQADAAGRRWLRMTVMNPFTDEVVMGRLLDTIEELSPA